MIYLEKYTNLEGTIRILLRVRQGAELHSILSTLPNIVTLTKDDTYTIPYTKADYNLFLSLGIPYRLHTSNNRNLESNIDNTSIDESRKPAENLISSVTSGTDIDKETQSWTTATVVTYHDGKFTLDLPYSSEAIAWVKTLQKAYWQPKHKKWIAKGTVDNLNIIQDRLMAYTDLQLVQVREFIGKANNAKRITIWQSPDHKGKVLLKLEGYGIDVSPVQQLAHREYDKQYKRWSIPHDASVIKRLIDHYTLSDTKVIYRLQEGGKVYDKVDKSYGHQFSVLLSKIAPPLRPMAILYVDTMIAQRYSNQTIKQYTGKFIRFMEYFEGKSPESLSATQVNHYISLLSKQSISDSSLNMSISAIRYFYTKVKHLPDFKIEQIKRPRNGRYLPAILSQAEVSRLLSACTNLKHCSILYTLYSSGIRLQELLSIKLTDIYWDRNQIFIRAGKGKKDRVVQLSQVLKSVLVLYFNEYKPIYWLYEGADRQTQYTSGSVQKVLKKAARLAGIQRKVTPHILRHCYATHLHDGGTSIKYIQELLGHKNIKTTLIYTHVSNNDTANIESPLDKLMLNKGKNPN